MRGSHHDDGDGHAPLRGQKKTDGTGAHPRNIDLLRAPGGHIGHLHGDGIQSGLLHGSEIALESALAQQQVDRESSGRNDRENLECLSKNGNHHSATTYLEITGAPKS
jgi:hypothetical protein